MSQTFAYSHLREHQLSGISLTESESSGAVATSFFERRRHMLPHDWPSPVSRFLDRSHSHQPAPRPSPSAHRPAPRNPGTATAA